MKIGITTLHNYNFGSALQCFATQEYLAKKGIESEVVDIAGSVNPLKHVVSVVWGLLCLCIKHPLSTKKILKMFLSQRGGSLTLTSESMNSLQQFNDVFLQRFTYTRKHLQDLAHSDVFDYFFSGSDQVWNGARIDQYDKYFLRFAPKEKRVAWAASFGGGRVEDYNITRYKRYISDFMHISVREKSGIEIVKELTGRSSVNLPDPIMLLSAQQWREKTEITPPIIPQTAIY
mgnify:CR=1 FL=1